MQKTEIQWCDSTVNPTTGCDGCELWAVLQGGPCYAGNYHEGRMAKALPALYDASFTEVRLAPGRMAEAAKWPDLTGTARPNKPWLDGMPRTIFVGDMGDIFSKDVPFDYLKREVVDIALSAKGSRHIWMLLTKQPRRMAEFGKWLWRGGLDWPSNIWAGTSITRQSSLRRVQYLAEVPAVVRFVSAEPLREFVNLDSYLVGCGISQVIIGGESKQRGYKPHGFNVNWARCLIHECREAGVKPFVKQLGSRPYVTHYNENSTTDCGQDVFFDLKDSHGGDWSEWPAVLRVREMPTPAGAKS